jgi:hypothetical protein
VPGGALHGHVLLFAASLRRCLFVHFATRVESAAEDEELSTRLAIARERIVRGIVVDPPRTHEGAEVPRDRPEIRRP